MFDNMAAKFGYASGEFSSDEFFPYIDHIEPTVMLLADNSIMSVLRMPGAPFALVMNGERNAGKRRLVAFLNAAADENVEVHIHLVKHDAMLPGATHAEGIAPYARLLLADYHASIADDLAIVDWFLTVRVKPRKQPFASITDKIKGIITSAGLASKSHVMDPQLEVQLADAMRLAMGTLKPFGPVLLGLRYDAVGCDEPLVYSEIAEFLYLLRTCQFSPQPLADVLGFIGAGIAGVDVTEIAHKRMLRIDHAAGGSPATQTYAAVLGFLTYPRQLDQSRFDDLLSLPGRFVMTTAIRFKSRAEMQSSLELLQRRLVSGNNRAREDTDALEDAISQVAGGRAESGISRWSLVVHGGTSVEVDRLVSAARNIVANAGAKVGLESKGKLNAFLAQLPGAPLSTWIRPATCTTKQVSVLASLAGHARGPAKPRWNHHLFRMLSPAGTVYNHDLFVDDVGHNYLSAPNGTGKCLAKGTPVMLFNGSVIPVEDVQINDILMGPDSSPRRVMSLARGREEMFKITPKKGDSYIVNRSHILSLKMCGGAIKNFPKIPPYSIINISVDDYLKKTKTFKNCAVGWRTAVNFADHGITLPLPSYLLGVWLGDGSSWRPEIHTPEPEIKEYLQKYAKEIGADLHVTQMPGCEMCVFVGGGVRPREHYAAGPFGYVRHSLLRLGVLAKANEPGSGSIKHIPDIYKTASRADRMDLLAGILDTDGHNSGSGFELTFLSERLMDDVIFVARSLGFAAFKHQTTKTCTNNGAVGTYWRCHINGAIETIPCKVPRKKARPRQQVKDVLMTGLRSVESVGEGDYYGFSIDGPDRLFLLGDFTVTHNTVFMAMSIAALDSLVRAKGGTQIVLDVDQSNHNTIKMLQGRYSTIEAGHSGLAPLRGLPDTPRVRAMLRDLIAGLVQTDGAPAPSKAERDGIRAGVDFVMGVLAPEERSFDIIRSYMGFEENGAGDRLEPWCDGNELGWVFDGPVHEIDFNTRLVGADLTAIMNDARIMPPVAMLMLWMASDVMDGRRVVIWCEEAPAYMPTPAFAKPFKGIALRARKRNASFNAIAQQPSDMLSNEAGHALVKQARQMIFFRNDKAVRADYCEGCGCTPAEFRVISEDMFTIPHHTVLIKRQDGQSGLNRFDLSSLPQHLNILSGTPQRVRLLQDCFRRHGDDEMAAFTEFQKRIGETAA